MMKFYISIICPLIELVLCFVSLILHIIVLPASYWALFRARTHLGLPEEYGHYGFWSLCSIKAPLYRDDCDPLDTFFRPPNHMWSAGIVASLHAFILGLFIPFALLRLHQISRNKPNLFIRPKTIVLIKISLIIIASVLVGLILLLTTLRESISREQIIFHTSSLENYDITKGWAFWVEVCVSIIDFFIIILCFIENNQLNKSELLIYSTNPSPNSMTRMNSISEYLNPHFRAYNHSHNQDFNNISTISDKSLDGWSRCNSHRCQLEDKNLPFIPFHSTSFTNPAFLNDSPDFKTNGRH